MADTDHIPITLAAALSAMTEEDYIHLASRGLLRRAQKELEKGVDVEIVKITPEGMEIRAGQHTVHMPGSGPNAARCSCPSPGICQHILMACLRIPALVQPETESNSTSNESADVSATEAESSNPREDLLGLSMTAMREWAGLPAMRAGIKIILDSDRKWIIHEGRVIQIQIPRASVVCRCPPGVSLEGIITTAGSKQRKAHVIAAVLAYQIHHGLNPDLSAVTPKSPTGDLTAVSSREEVLANVRILLHNTLDTGLSHLSFSPINRYSALAYAAQGVRLYRLSLLLRSVADEIEQLLGRIAQSDTEALLDKLATTYALVEAIENTPGLLPAWLAGQARTLYEESETLTLAGLGGYAWKTPSGYLGLTVLFLEIDSGEILTWSDVRPETAAAGFDPVRRFEELSPWRGGITVKRLAESVFQLYEARRNEDGRISGNDETRVEIRESANLSTVENCSRFYTEWEPLRKHVSENRSLGLRRESPTSLIVILQPARWGSNQYDEAFQAFAWKLFDRQGEELPLWIEYDPYNAAAIDALEHLKPGNGDCLAGIMRFSPELHLFPVAVIRKDGSNGVISLGLKQKETQDSSWWQKISRRFSQTGSPVLTSEASLPDGSLQQVYPVFNALDDFLLAKAEGGTRRFSEEERKSLESIKQELDKLGFIQLSQVAAHALNHQQPLCRSILVLRYLLGLHAQVGVT